MKRRREDRDKLPACVTALNINTLLISARHDDEDDDDEAPRTECSPSRESLCVWRTKIPKRTAGPSEVRLRISAGVMTPHPDNDPTGCWGQRLQSQLIS